MKNTTSEKINAFDELEQSVYTALENYSNVHRGSGHNSMLTTHLFEKARNIVLEYLGLSKGQYHVVFCTAQRAESLIKHLKPGSYQLLSSKDIGLAIGVQALAVKKGDLPKGNPLEAGGGTAKLISKEWIIWAGKPDKFEAGTPAIVNIIAFAKALRLIQKSGKGIFLNPEAKELTIEDILYYDELKDYSGNELLDELKKTLIGRDINVPTTEGASSFVNLDNSASTPTFKPIWDAFRQTLKQPAQIQQKIIQEVNTICAKQLGAPPAMYDILFTSNTTEAINLAAKNFSHTIDEGTEMVVLNTLLEHTSNELPWRILPNSSILRLAVDSDGFIDLKELDTLLDEYNHKQLFGKKRIKLLAISGASNVLGTCNKIEDISHIAHKHGAQLLVDAAQLVAHSSINMEASGIDYLAFSAHKVYAPFGCGALLIRKELIKISAEELNQIKLSGEENAGGIAALGKAFAILQKIGMDLIHQKEQALTKSLLLGLVDIPNIRVHGINKPEHLDFERKLGVVAFDLKNIMANRVAKELAIQGGIGVRSGCHCAHIIVKHMLNISPGLEKFQRIMQSLFPKMNLPGVTRVSLGIENTEKDVDKLIYTLHKIAKKTNSKENTKNLLPKSGVKIQMKEYIKDISMKVYS